MIFTSAWWAALNLFEQILYCIAIGSSVVLILQIVMIFAGGFSGADGVDGGFSNPSDTSGIDADLSGADGIDGSDLADLADGADMPIGGDGSIGTLKLFTFQGIVAFLATFSWITILCLSADFNIIAAVMVGLGFGIIMMFAIAKLIQLLMKLSDDGTVDFENAVGVRATVYIPIPGDLSGEGKVIAEFQGAERECSAITAGKDPIPTNADVLVTSVRGNTLVVERV